MTLQVVALTRIFEFNGVHLPDPNPSLSPREAVDLIAAAGRPDLMTAEIRGPEQRGRDMVYSLHRAVGTKGARLMARRLAGYKTGDRERVDRSMLAALNALRANLGEDVLALPSAMLPWLG